MCETLKRASGEAMLFEDIDLLLQDTCRVLLQPVTVDLNGSPYFLAPGAQSQIPEML